VSECVCLWVILTSVWGVCVAGVRRNEVSHSHTHTYPRSHTHTNTQTCTHTHTHTHKHARAHTNARAHTHTRQIGRRQAFQRFAKAKAGVMLCTDVAARGVCACVLHVCARVCVLVKVCMCASVCRIGFSRCRLDCAVRPTAHAHKHMHKYTRTCTLQVWIFPM